jgi:hypothetical protein
MGFAGAVLAGGASAACLAFALTHGDTLLIFVAYLTAIPLFIAGLGAGSVSGLIAAAAGFAALLLTQPSNYAFIYAFLFAIPCVGLTTLALRYRIGDDQKIYWYPEGYLLTATTFYPCVIFLVIVVATMGAEGGLLGLTTRLLQETFEPMKSQLKPNLIPQMSSMIDHLVMLLPAVISCAWIFLIIISAVAAQMVLQQQKWSLRDNFNLANLHAPKWIVFILVVTVLAGSLGGPPYNYIGTNLGVIIAIPFFFTGLSIIHALAPLTGAPTVTLIVFYVVLSLLVWLCLPVAVLGIVDQWVNFRQRFAIGNKRVE